MTALKNNNRSTKAQLRVEALEDRLVMSTLPIPTIPIKVPADYAGSTMAEARPVVVANMAHVSVADTLANANDIDMYKINLNKGDFLAIDVDKTGSAALASKMTYWGPNGQMTTVFAGTEPESGIPGSDPSTGFFASESGTYYIQLSTTATASSASRTYKFNFDRVGMNAQQANAVLEKTGSFHVWLNQDSTILKVSGPSGYGFSLEGKWTKTVSGNTVKYAPTGVFYLRTAFVDGTTGKIALQGSGKGGFSISAKAAPGWDRLGTMTSVSGNFGLSLAPFAGEISKITGLDVNNLPAVTSWTIMSGSQIKAKFPQYDVSRFLDGVPYLVYGGKPGQVKAELGDASITTGSSDSLMIVADPTDPALFVDYKNYALGVSAHGRIPFNAGVQIKPDQDDPLTALPGAYQIQKEYFGNVYFHTDQPLYTVPVGPIAVTLGAHAGVVVDLDANDDGSMLAGKASSWEVFTHLNDQDVVEALRDINLGIEGFIDLSTDIGPYHLSVPVGVGSFLYDGTQQAAAFEVLTGTAVDAFKNTPLSYLDCGPGTTWEGTVYGNGHFDLAITSSYKLFGMTAALTVSASYHGQPSNSGFGVEGTVTTPIGDVIVNGQILANGDFHLTGNMHVGIGTSKNGIHGTAYFNLDKVGSQLKIHALGTIDARFTLPELGVRLDGSVTGYLDLTVNANGSKSYAVGLKFNGHFQTYTPGFGWNGGVEVEDLGVSLSGKTLKLTYAGYTFKLELP